MNATTRQQLGDLRGRVRFDEPLSRHTTFRVGGPADALVEPADEADLLRALAIAHGAGAPVTVLGEGSNVLVSDLGVRGVVLRLRAGFDEIAVTRDAFGPGAHRLDAGGGVAIFRLLKECRDRRLSGLELLAGVPGTVGGAVRMNAGTYLGETRDACVEIVKVATGAAPVPVTVSAAALGFRYRHTNLGPGDIVLRASFKVRDADSELYAKIDALLERRKQTQPLSLPNAGSFFRNPPGDKAGRLIEAAGLKGARIGGAEVSTLHANFLVNAGGATASDLRALGEHVQAVVQRRFGVTLEWEVKLMGEWP